MSSLRVCDFVFFLSMLLAILLASFLAELGYLLICTNAVAKKNYILKYLYFKIFYIKYKLLRDQTQHA